MAERSKAPDSRFKSFCSSTVGRAFWSTYVGVGSNPTSDRLIFFGDVLLVLNFPLDFLGWKYIQERADPDWVASCAAWTFLVCLSECQCFLSFDWCLLLRLNGCKDIVAEFSTSLFLSCYFGALRVLFFHRYSSDNKTISIYNLNFAIAVFRRS